MKQKKNAAKPATKQPVPAAEGSSPETVDQAAIQLEGAALEETFTRRDTLKVVLFSCLLFAAMTIIIVRSALILAVAGFCLCLGKDARQRLKTRLSLPVAGLLGLALMYGLAAIYTPFDELASVELSRFLVSFSLCLVLLAHFGKRHVRALVWGFTAVVAVIALLSVDMSAAQVLFTPFNALMNALGVRDYALSLASSPIARANGIFNDANVTACMFALTTLTGLYLMDTEKVEWKKFTAATLLGLSGLGLLTTVSRGAWLCFALTLLVYLVVAGKGQRFPLFCRMVLSGVTILAVGMAVFRTMQTDSVLSLPLLLFCGVPIYLLERFVTVRLAAIRLPSGRKLAVFAACLAVALCAAAAVALTATKPYVFDETYLLRATELSAGEYTLSLDCDDPTAKVSIYTHTPEQTLLFQKTILYEGLISEASFTLPEKQMVFFFMWGEPGKELREVRVSDGTKLPMAYRFIPKTISDRLQGNLLEDHSVLQRLQYDKDALKIFRMSPIIGHGLGSTEGLFTAVQPFYYESKYVHNHILQFLTDMGLLGLCGFLALVGGVLWLCLRRLRKEADPLAAVLAAVVVMMNLHSLIEINFSVRPFQCLAYPMLLLPVLAFSVPFGAAASYRAAQKRAELAGRAWACALLACLGVFTGLMVSHRIVERKVLTFEADSVEEFLPAVKNFIRWDVFDRETLKVSFIAEAVQSNNAEYATDVYRYVKDLRNYGTFTANTGLAQYFYFPIRDFQNGFASSMEGIAQKASDAQAWNAEIEDYWDQFLPAVNGDNVEKYLDGVLSVKAYYERYNDGRIDPIVLTEANQAFLDTVASIRDQGITGEEAVEILNAAVQGLTVQE